MSRRESGLLFNNTIAMKKNWILREERLSYMVDDLKDGIESARGSTQLNVVEENWESNKQLSLGCIAKIVVECIGLECMISLFH